MFYTNDIISDLSGHHSAPDCISHSHLNYMCCAKGHFRLDRDLMMTDNSCKTFRLGVLGHQILNDNTSFLKKEILLKTIIAVHRFGIYCSVWCRAKIFDFDQAAFSASCCLHCSFMYESFPIETML